MIKFEEIEYELPFDEERPVSKSYITLVQANNFQRVEITEEECENSVRFLSRLRKKRKSKKK